MIEKIKKVKLKGNESFNFREGWLRKGMRLINEHEGLFARDDVMELLGVGSKMVKSIRFWLQATGVCEERYINSGRARVQFLTDNFGRIIFDCDPYFDDLFTLSLIHYKIASNEELCIAWNIFFNEFDGTDFSREKLVEISREKLQRKLAEGVTFSEKSLADDCASVIKMYLESETTDDPEESLGSPLAELGLVKKSAKARNTFIKSAPSKDDLDKLAVLYVMVCNLSKEKQSVSIEDLINSPNNVGRIFNLNRVLINEYLDQLRISGYLTINRTAGLNMVYFEKTIRPEDVMIDYYEKAQVR